MRQFAPRNSLLVKSPVPGIKRKIQFQYVDPWLAQKAELSVLGVLTNQCFHFGLWHLTFGCYPPYLKLRRCGRDVGIQS